MANTVTIPNDMKVRVAVTDRGDRRPRPHTPWPLVQPPPMRVPIPTSNPLMAISQVGAVDSSGKGCPMTVCVSKPPRSKPNKNSHRQPRSGPASDPQAMPLMPATRPSVRSNQMAEKPSRTPPMRGKKYVFTDMRRSAQKRFG